MSEEARLAALRGLEIDYQERDPLLDLICALAKDIFAVPVVFVSLLDRDKQWLKARCGIDVQSTPRDVAFCNVTIKSDDTVVVEDATQDDRFSSNPLVVGAPGVRFYAGAPLSLDAGFRLGSMCLVDFKPRIFDRRDRARLKDLADLVVGQLRLHRAAVDLRAQTVTLNRKDELLARTEALAKVGGWELDPVDGLALTDQARHIFGLRRGERFGMQRVLASFGPSDRVALEAHLKSAASEGDVFQFEARCSPNENTARWLGIIGHGERVQGTVSRAVGSVQDITERKAAEAQLIWAGTHDGLTALPNRQFLNARLAEAIKRRDAHDSVVGLLVIDLDNFKEVNDTLGHEAGDRVLKLVADRLSKATQPPMTVARLGGDEFAVLIPEAKTIKEIEMVAHHLGAVLRVPVAYLGESLFCSASIGISVCPNHESDPSEMLKSADLALYAAKREGRNKAVVYKPTMRDRFHARINVLSRARHALATHAIVPHYQPKLCLRTGRVVGFEALMRWVDPGRGLQPPGTIQTALDDPILSVELGHRMLDLVVADMADWQRRHLEFGTVAVNLSAAEFSRRDLPEHILRLLSNAHLPTGILEIEVTETAFLGESSRIGKALRTLSERGVAIALDDFGTGYASLTHLKQFPVDWLKLDRSFIKDIEINRDSTSIVRSVIGLAHELGIGIVAEGIETRQQLDYLRLHRCDVGQGFLFSKAMAASRIPHYLATFDARGLEGTPVCVAAAL